MGGVWLSEAAKELIHEAGMDSELAGTSPPPNVLNVDETAPGTYHISAY